jgi:8-oxo-dGTP pyrophosphatase MutT (NUDIX family)
MDQPPVIQRPVARVLLFDERDRLLLLFDPDPDRGQYWYPPGGRIEPGETPQAAARRELVEEIGVDAGIGPAVLRRRARFTYGDRRFDQAEWHFTARVSDPVVPVSRPGDNEARAVAAHRWWSLSELRASTDRFFPEGLADTVERFLGASTADPRSSDC